MENQHMRSYKNHGRGVEEVRRRQNECTVELRKNKRDDVIQKKRNITASVEDEGKDDISNEIITPEFVSRLAEQGISLNPEIKLNAIKKARQLLSSDKNPPIEEMINNKNMLHALVEALKATDHPMLQFEAAWSLTNIASGTSEQTHAVVEAGAVPPLIDLLNSPDESVSEQSLWALGNIIGDGPDLRNKVIEADLMRRILILFETTSCPQISFLRNLAWVFVNICRNKTPAPNIEIVKQIVPILKYFMQYITDTTMIIDAIWTVSYITDHGNDGIELIINYQLVEIIAPLLDHPDLKIQTPALRVIGNIVTGNDDQTQYVLDQKVLNYVPKLLIHQKEKIKKETLWFISNITAGREDQIQTLIDNDIIELVIPFLTSDSFMLQREAAWVISNMAHNGNKGQIEHLVKLGVIKPICEALTIQDTQVKQLLLESLLKFLTHYADESEIVSQQIEEFGGLDLIESLQEDPSEDIYKLSLEIIEKFFSEGDVPELV